MDNIDNNTSKIRRVTVGLDMNNQMSYLLGAKHSVYIDEKKELRKIKLIRETDNHFLIYLEGEVVDEAQLWKKLPKNNMTTVEFIID
ncbi:MAG TPA: hypothetical protein VIV55_10080 [Flavobacterium sp.]